MLSHAAFASPAASGARPWREAWTDAAYGVDGFWSRERPGDHFRTGVSSGNVVARAVAALVPAGTEVVLDVGAGDGDLLVALAGLLPRVALVGVDRRPRPAGLPSTIGWVVDHLDVETVRWDGGGWSRLPQGRPFVVAHEWLDDLPLTITVREVGGWRELLVEADGTERVGGPVGADDCAWLDRWWPDGTRAEVGRTRDGAWAELVETAVGRGGCALAVDYGHVRSVRPSGGSLTAYGSGRVRRAVPDGSVNLTAHVAVDALARAGEAAGGRTVLLERQSSVLSRLAPERSGDTLRDLVARGEHRAATAPQIGGDLWWLLQSADGDEYSAPSSVPHPRRH